MPDFLLELGTEELPARFIDRAIRELRKIVEKSLGEALLPPVEIKVGGTPRRLALWAGGLPERQPDQLLEKAGPRASAAKKDGEWTVPATKFAESMGVSVDALEIRSIEKKGKSAEYLYASRTVEGRPSATVLGELIPKWIDGLPFAKSMRWIEGSKLRFGRPLRRIAALLGDPATGGSEVVSAAWGDVESSRKTEGHRFLHEETFTLKTASWDDYVALLMEQHVVVDTEERRRRVVDGLRTHLGDEGLERYSKLVNEVVNLVEWPDVDVGTFSDHLLKLPEIVIAEAMTGHQRYFPVRENGKLAPRFAYVANRPLHPVIREGNERVLNARLQDALFFYDQDQKTPLSEQIDGLESIVFMQGVGSLKDRISRVMPLTLKVAKTLGWAPKDAAAPAVGTKVTRSLNRMVSDIQWAAQLARVDLLTEVVGEFPELQGEIGAIYARQQDQTEAVAEAIRESYLPRGEGDALPETQVGICLAIADKLDTIVCAWATGKKPTGSGDPFMVRRSTLGILRILRERELDMGYLPLLERAVDLLPSELVKPWLLPELQAFFEERLNVMATAKKGEARDKRLTRLVLKAGTDSSNVLDFWLRLDALQELAKDDRFGPLCELVERTKTITEKNGADVDPTDVDTARLEDDAEKALHAALEGCRESVRQAISERRYVDAGKAYVDALAQVTHTFFEPAPVGVFVMHDDARLRTNRLALLKQVHALLADGFADLAAKEEAKGGKKGKKKS